jgi:DNA-binding transcriptional LysR family regulator
MDWAQLQAVAAVARHKSFSGAAAELGLTQSGVSRQVQKLERELGVTLFVRRPAGMLLTQAGERVHTYAADALARRQQLLEELHATPDAVSGVLSIAASTTPGEFLVSRLIAGFQTQFPAVRTQVQISDSAQVVEALQQRQAEVGFVGARFPGRGLEYVVVAEDEVVLAVPTAHRLARHTEVALNELSDEAFIEREGGSGTLLSVRRSLAAHGLRLPRHRVVMVLSTTQAIVSAVESGYGLGWVSSLALAGRSTERVRTVRLRGQPIRRQLAMVTLAQATPSPPANEFIGWVRRTASCTTQTYLP